MKVTWGPMSNKKKFRPQSELPTIDVHQKKLHEAISLHQLGHLVEAKRLYGEILKASSKHFDALHLSGLIEQQTGHFAQARHFFEKALRIKSDFAPLYSNHGLVLHSLGLFEEALVNYETATALKPDHAEAYSNAGNTLQELFRYEEALAKYDMAISVRREYAEAYYNRGVLLQKLLRFDAALECYDEVVNLNPRHFEAYYNRGGCLQELNRLEEAIMSYDKAVAAKPDYRDAFSSRGNALKDLKRFDEALWNYDRSIEINPHCAEDHSNRGGLLQQMGRWEEALISYDRAAAIDPYYANAFYNRGNLLYDLNRFDEGLLDYDRAIKIRPDHFDAHANRGNALKELKRFDDALESYRRAASLRENSPELLLNMGQLLLLMGHFEDGLTFYEWRKKTKEANGSRCFQQPLWLGEESLKGKKILIHEEQGVGDVIQFCRYLKRLEEKGAAVTVAVTDKLMSLVGSLGGAIKVCSIRNIPSDFDVHCPLMSLPLAFKTNPATIPAETPYLFADQKRADAFRRMLSRDGAAKICGLSWRSNAEKTGATRSLALTDLFNAIDPAGYVFVNLQYGDVGDELAALKAHNDVDIKSIPEIDIHDDMDGFAALVGACDIVISIDNTTVHLAGALNKKTCVMLPYVPDWRWMLDREDSPWYPSTRLFRQDRPGDWSAVFSKIRSALRDELHATD